MIAINQDEIKIVHTELEDEIKIHADKALKKLYKINKNRFKEEEKLYLKKVICLFENRDVLKAVPVELEIFKRFIGVLPSVNNLNNKKPKKKLKDYIIDALNYTYLRNNFYPKYFKKLELKSCVYCNSQLTITTSKKVIKGKDTYSAKFDVDHYYPKADYPFLSISLFNLYPVCSSCNRLKGKKIIDFKLYTNDIQKINKSDFTFKLDPYFKAKYLTNKTSDIIKIRLETSNLKFKETFHIEEIYNTQNDLVEEMIIKSLIYNKDLKLLLNRSFNNLSLSSKYYKRFLVGNYAEVKEIHKRPMSKFMQDIARELGIIG